MHASEQHMRFVCSILSAVGLLLVSAQFCSRNPFATPFLVLDGFVAFIVVITAALWAPNPCKDNSYQRVDVTPKPGV